LLLLWLIMENTTTSTLHGCDILVNLIIVIINREATTIDLRLRLILAIRIVREVGGHGVCSVIHITG
jgi:hypothetical protein